MTGDVEMGTTTTTTTTRRPRRRGNEETERRPESYYASSYNESPMGTFVRGTRDERATTWGLRGFVPPKKFRVDAYAYAHCEESDGERVETRMNGGWMSRRSVDGTREMTTGEEGDGEEEEAEARERGAGAARREAATRRRQVGGMTSRPSWGTGMMTKAAAC